jgi:hypothetical protein
MAMTGKNRIMIYGPKNDGTYVVEFRTAAGEALAISIPSGEARVVRYFQERMPYGLFVPDVSVRNLGAPNESLPLDLKGRSELRAARATCRRE